MTLSVAALVDNPDMPVPRRMFIPLFHSASSGLGPNSVIPMDTRIRIYSLETCVLYLESHAMSSVFFSSMLQAQICHNT
jgi:hypothetical protein